MNFALRHIPSNRIGNGPIPAGRIDIIIGIIEPTDG